ncbi:DUF3795 domain-containing protein [Anaerofustis stercorihominis]|uniref:DUF3795 domain-containing protein n=1 Tax=Anaerofustis stercorihominis TaxID=214853 RepID=A0A3E3DZ10_9FIRM|nr:DUF3795 domain-containing protein [Anaerofustis stercorihominis]MCQ4794215.1 DUF3795 domain-containing protein [Anaerofustis stercorihominis]RGD74531.1 DUF3795 domain-containing protein [Anaerofustis stercorihominis]
MYESRCGVPCSECERKEDVGCIGCLNMEKPFWGGDCHVKKCAEDKDYHHCGECKDFPCEVVSTMGTEMGFDPKPRLDNLKKWRDEEK